MQIAYKPRAAAAAAAAAFLAFPFRVRNRKYTKRKSKRADKSCRPAHFPAFGAAK